MTTTIIFELDGLVTLSEANLIVETMHQALKDADLAWAVIDTKIGIKQ